MSKAEILSRILTAEADALGIIDAARTKAVKEADAVGADGDEQIAAIKNNSDSRRKDAVDVVLASFMGE